MLVTSVCAHQCDVACGKKSCKTAKGDVVGTGKDLSRDKNPLHDNKHSPQFQHEDMITQNMNKNTEVDELILVSYIRSLSHIIRPPPTVFHPD